MAGLNKKHSLSVAVGSGVDHTEDEDVMTKNTSTIPVQDIIKTIPSDSEDDKLPEVEPLTDDFVPSDEEGSIAFDADDKPQEIKIRDINDRFIYDKTGTKKLWNKPFFKGQSKKQGFWQYGYPITKVFHLEKPEELDEYNKLLCQVGTEFKDPNLTIIYHDRQFFNGEFIVLVTYKEIWYLLPKQ